MNRRLQQGQCWRALGFVPRYLFTCCVMINIKPQCEVSPSKKPQRAWHRGSCYVSVSPFCGEWGVNVFPQCPDHQGLYFTKMMKTVAFLSMNNPSVFPGTVKLAQCSTFLNKSKTKLFWLNIRKIWFKYWMVVFEKTTCLDLWVVGEWFLSDIC